MELIVVVGFAGLVGYALYLIQKPNNDDDSVKPKRKRGGHPLRHQTFSGEVDNARNHRQRKSNNPVALYYGTRGHNALKQQKYEHAIDLFNRAIKASPNCTTFYINRGIAHLNLQEIDQARENFLRVIELDADDWLGYSNLAAINYNTFDFPQTVTYANQATELNENALYPYILRGAAYIHLGDLDAALDDHLVLLNRAPDNDAGYSGYANVLMRLGDHQQALDMLSQRIEAVPQAYIIYNDRAWYRAYLGDAAGSLADAEQAIALAGKNPIPNIYGTLGQAKWLQDDYEGALAAFSHAREIAPPLYQAIYSVEEAVAMYTLGREQDAITIWQQIIAQHPYLKTADDFQTFYLYAQPMAEAMRRLERSAASAKSADN